MNQDVMRQLGATGNGPTARLGSSLHVKGDISGSEDLLIEGSVEGDCSKTISKAADYCRGRDDHR